MNRGAETLRRRLGELARARGSAVRADDSGAPADAAADEPGAGPGVPRVGTLGLASCSASLSLRSLRHPWLPLAPGTPPLGTPGPALDPDLAVRVPELGAPGQADLGVRVPELGAPGQAPPSRDRAGVEAFLPGGEWRDGRGAVFVHERLRSDVERRREHWGRPGVAPETEADLAALCALGLEHALFLDLETGGLAASPVFLAGTMHWNGSDFVLRQYFARHYGEEATLIGALAEATRGFEFLVTFNGKSYDAPFLRDRARVHGVRLGLPPRHLDLLHPARRRWRLELPDCRLQTLEWRVCRRRRVGDVPGDEVPGLYHDFVRRGDPYRLVPVFHHNLLDVITMAEVLAALCGVERRSRRRAGEGLPAAG